MKCSKCGFENREGVKFCEECGVKLELVCLGCGAKMPLDRLFCGECGLDLHLPREAPQLDYSKPHSYTPKHLTDKILTTRSSLEGARKLVTVLFADVANYTSISEKLDPEEVHGIMDGCFKILMDEIHRHDGTINQFTGDGVMALFGAPVAHEDHAHRACNAALSIQKSLDVYAKQMKTHHGIDFRMRLGLNSGLVVVGSIGDDLRMDYTAVGDTTNLASRMQSMAEPGTIVVSPSTYSAIAQTFELKPLGKGKVKGKSEILETYELLREKTYRPRLGLERAITSEMVGRDNEIHRLELQVLKAINGNGSVVNIIGEAGIGKTRLISELRRQERIKEVTLLEGRAISIGVNLSFHPFIDIFKRWAGIRPDDPPDAAYSKLERAIMNVSGDQSYEIFPFVAKLMGIRPIGRYAERVKGIEGEALEKLIQKSVRELCSQASKITPLIILMEDLHWADNSSIELLEAIFRLVETNRIVFINVFRPGHKHTSDRIVNTLATSPTIFSVNIVLDQLDEQMSESLIKQLLKGRKLPHPLLNQIVQRSGGNPFFIEEVIHSLVEDGALVLRNNVFEVTDKIHTTVIPHTIQDVLMARIDRLEEQTQLLVKVASVIGKSFFHRILAEVAQTIKDVDIRLSHLTNAQLICERFRLDELEYVFKHALVQETAYESILKIKRKGLHLKVAQCIEATFKEKRGEFFGQLAYHYSMGEDLAKAEEYLIRAGQEALSSSASSEAIHFFEEALQLFLKRRGDLSDPAKQAMLETNIAIALCNRGQYADSVIHFDKALASYGEHLPKNTASILLNFSLSVLAYLANLYLPSLRFSKDPTRSDIEVIELLYRRITALGVTDPKRMFIEGFYVFRKIGRFDITKLENGLAYLVGGSPLMSWSGVSLKLARRALETIKDKVDKEDIRVMLYYAGAEMLYVSLGGDWGKEGEYNEVLVDAGAKRGEFFWAAIYTYWQGYLDIERGRFSEAQRKIAKLDRIADDYDNNYARVLKYALNVVFLTKSGNYREGIDESDRGIKFAMRVGLGIWAFSMYSMKARGQALCGDIKGAEKSLDEARQLKTEINVVPIYLCNFLLSEFIMNVRRMTEAHMNQSKSEVYEANRRAIRSGRKAVTTSRKAAPERIEAYRLMGSLFWLNGKMRKAMMWWNRAIREGERLGANLELAKTYAEVGKQLVRQGGGKIDLNGIDGKDYLKMARSKFEEMKLDRHLDELEIMDSGSGGL